jgi:hypothetical protein
MYEVSQIHIGNKTKNIIKVLFKIDDEVYSGMVDIIHRQTMTSGKGRRIWDYYNFILMLLPLGIMLSNLLNRVLFRNYNDQNITEKYVFNTEMTSSPKFTIMEELMANDLYCVCHIPTLHMNSMYKYFKRNHHRQQNYRMLRFGNIYARYLNSILCDYKYIRQIVKDIRENNNLYTSRIIIQNIISYWLFDIYKYQYYNSLINSCTLIFDADKPPQYLPIVSEAKRQGRNNICLQHGSFFAENKFYLPAVASTVFCCSERERKLFIEAGHSKDDIFVIGAPLQSLEIKRPFDYGYKDKYRVLLILSEMSEEYYPLQEELIQYLYSKDIPTLIRLRPASAPSDLKRIGTTPNQFMRISEGKSLEQDIFRSELLITFSYDSVYSCMRSGKAFYLYLNNRASNEISHKYEGPYFTSVKNLIQIIEINDFGSNKYIYSSFMYNHGDPNILNIKQNLRTALLSLENR